MAHEVTNQVKEPKIDMFIHLYELFEIREHFVFLLDNSHLPKLIDFIIIEHFLLKNLCMRL